MSQPQTAEAVLSRHFIEMRHRLLDLAAILDRIDRGRDAAAVATDARLSHVREALDVLHGDQSGRAERIQRLFSLPYDPQWRVS